MAAWTLKVETPNVFFVCVPQKKVHNLLTHGLIQSYRIFYCFKYVPCVLLSIFLLPNSSTGNEELCIFSIL